MIFAPLAQLDRAPDYESGGHTFKSCRVRNKKHIYSFLALACDDKYLSWIINSKKEIYHLKNALRLAVGDKINVFDGNGNFGTCIISEIQNNLVTANCISHVFKKKSKPSITIALGAVKTNTLRDLIPVFVESNVDNLIIFGQKNVAKHLYCPKLKEKIYDIILNATKQTKSAFLMSVNIFKSIYDMFIDVDFSNHKKFFLNQHFGQNLLNINICKKDILCIIGSERGFDIDEKKAIVNQNFLNINLGQNVFRSYSAAIASALILSLKRNV